MHDLEEHVVALLRTDPEPIVPLSRIHHALRAEPAGREIDQVGLYHRLRRRPDLFHVFEPRHAAWGDDWPDEIRGEYESALRDAGLEPGPRIALATRQPDPDAAVSGEEPDLRLVPTLRCLETTLLDLWIAAEEDDSNRVEILEALDEADKIRRLLAFESD